MKLIVQLVLIVAILHGDLLALLFVNDLTLLHALVFHLLPRHLPALLARHLSALLARQLLHHRILHGLALLLGGVLGHGFVLCAAFATRLSVALLARHSLALLPGW